jgi:hypothetical protein
MSHRCPFLRHNPPMSSSILTALLVFLLNASSFKDDPQPLSHDPVADSALLTPDDKAILTEVLRLQSDLGEVLWPGFGAADIPIVSYDDQYEYLVGEETAPSFWTKVEGDEFEQRPYYRRVSSRPQSFAIRVDSRWAGSMSSLAYLNRRGPLRMIREFYIPLVLHEMFHAFQATEAPEHFHQARAVYAAESRYPAKEAAFITAWDREGALLAEALGVTDRAALTVKVREFLEARAGRRAQAGLTPDLVAFERELEWLEGLAKYVEDRVSDLATARRRDPRYASYRLPYWRQADTFRLSKQLGRQDGDLRFYLSGMAQARLLDVLRPGWKRKIMHPGIYTEDLLRAATE